MNINQQIIYYIHKRILGDYYLNSYDEYMMFENLLTNINFLKEIFMLRFYNDNLVLSLEQIEQIKNNISPFVKEQNQIGTGVRVLHGDLIHLKNIINEIVILENDKKTIMIEISKGILILYDNFIFEKLGIEILKTYNSFYGYCKNKYILDKNKNKNIDEYVYFDSYFHTYIVINNVEYGYNFYWIEYDNKIDDKIDNKIVLHKLEKKFLNLKFSINTSYSVTTLYFVPSKTNYIGAFHKVEEYLHSINIKPRKNIVFNLDLDR